MLQRHVEVFFFQNFAKKKDKKNLKHFIYATHVTKILNLEIITTTRKNLLYLVFKGALGFTLVIMRKQKSWMSFCVSAFN